MVLLKKLNIKKCRFLECQAWATTNFLFLTGLRQRSLIHLQIKDVDLSLRAAVARVRRASGGTDTEIDR